MTVIRWIAVLVALAYSQPSFAQQGDGTDTTYETTIFKPNKVEATDARIKALKLPDGFKISQFASGLKNPRILAVSAKGDVYVSRRDQGDVVLLRDVDGDGKADGDPVVVANRPGAHGLAIHESKLYLITVKELFVADLKDDGKLGPLKQLISDLPDAGQHGNRTIAFGPDGMLYISVGSTCNACNESSPESATILRVNLETKSRTIFASGLRNTIGFDWHPKTGALWGMDNGIDFLGDEAQPEELNKIEFGKQYGWPHIWGKDGVNPQSTPVGGITKEQWKASSVPMVLGYDAHAAPMQLVFYKGGGAFPAEYEGDAFLTFRGSWNRKAPSGYNIVRIRFENGEAKSIEPFLTGFLTDGGKTHFARPMGLAFATDGSLLMADDANGVVYRIGYDGSEKKSAGVASVPSDEMKRQTSKGSGVPLAFERDETKATTHDKITVTSPSFKDGESIPQRHSEYYDGVSPELKWSDVKGAKSYAIIVEDPDAKPVTPVVHWVAYNVPANVTSLPEGLQEQPRLTEPEGLLQGRSTRGSPGYVGPKPPVGDPDHHYHFQVLALDTVLELASGADRETVLSAVNGHVLGRGELIGLYRQTDAPLK